ncbi:hypothetical protein SAMN05519104_4928 [Rhizobiales bacterium GAS188]|nr:hypothetical protein SAMN05519104_4928 [Rhizobiales bacterium GAS188]
MPAAMPMGEMLSLRVILLEELILPLEAISATG